MGRSRIGVNFKRERAKVLCFSPPVCEREIELAAGGEYWVRDLVFRLFIFTMGNSIACLCIDGNAPIPSRRLKMQQREGTP